MLTIFQTVRKEEKAAVATGFFTLFGIMTGHLLMETARDTLFLSEIPPTELPLVYLAIAVIAFALTRLERFIHTGRRDLLLSGWLGIGAAGTVGFWLFLNQMGDLGLYALYIWPGLLITLGLIQFWTLLGGLLTMTDARRIYVLIGAGGVMGAIAGSGMASVITTLAPARHLLLAAAGILLVTMIGPYLMRRYRPIESSPREEDETGGLLETLKSILQEPYSLRVGALVLAATAGGTFADYIFKSSATRAVPVEDLGTFFAVVYFGLNVLSLLMQLFLVQRLIRRMSISGLLTVLPALFVVGGLGFVLGGAIFAAVGIKVVDGALKHSLHRTATELLYVPLGDVVRARLKAFVTVVGQRGGQALASLGILAGIALDLPLITYGAALAVVAGIWIFLARSLKQPYLDLFRDTLYEETSVPNRRLPEIDVASLESLGNTLDSQNDDEVLAALDILDEEGKSNLVPGLILYHPSEDIVCRALEIFARDGNSDFIPIVERLQATDREISPRVRAAIVSARGAVQPDEEWLRERLDDEDEVVRTAAVFQLTVHGWLESEEGKDRIQEVIESGSTRARVTLARAIGLGRTGGWEDELIALGRISEFKVRREVVEAMRMGQDQRFLETLRGFLSDRPLRSRVRETFVEYGSAGLEFLQESLEDETLPRTVRWELPAALCAFKSQEAARSMAARLPREEDGMIRYRIVRELERIRYHARDIPLEERYLHEACDRFLKFAFEIIDWRLTLGEEFDVMEEKAQRTHALLLAVLRDKQAHDTDILMRVLGLLHPQEDFGPIFRGIESSDPELLSSSLELLHFIVPADIREPVMALLEDIDDEMRLERGQNVYEPVERSYDQCLARLLDARSSILQCVVIQHIIDLERDAFLPKIRQLLPTRDSSLETLIEEAENHLADGGTESSEESESDQNEQNRPEADHG